jgi:hypothetical protein
MIWLDKDLNSFNDLKKILTPINVDTMRRATYYIHSKTGIGLLSAKLLVPGIIDEMNGVVNKHGPGYCYDILAIKRVMGHCSCDKHENVLWGAGTNRICYKCAEEQGLCQWCGRNIK